MTFEPRGVCTRQTPGDQGMAENLSGVMTVWLVSGVHRGNHLLCNVCSKKSPSQAGSRCYTMVPKFIRFRAKGGRCQGREGKWTLLALHPRSPASPLTGLEKHLALPATENCVLWRPVALARGRCTQHPTSPGLTRGPP